MDQETLTLQAFFTLSGIVDHLSETEFVKGLTTDEHESISKIIKEVIHIMRIYDGTSEHLGIAKTDIQAVVEHLKRFDPTIT
jgi:hypothetical protein